MCTHGIKSYLIIFYPFNLLSESLSSGIILHIYLCFISLFNYICFCIVFFFKITFASSFLNNYDIFIFLITLRRLHKIVRPLAC